MVRQCNHGGLTDALVSQHSISQSEALLDILSFLYLRLVLGTDNVVRDWSVSIRHCSVPIESRLCGDSNEIRPV